MKVITLNREAFLKKSVDLISKLDFEPQLVIGVLNGGGFLIEELRNHNYFKSMNFELVKLQRDHKIKKFKFVQFLLKFLPYKISNWLRNIESKKVRKSIKSFHLMEISSQEIELEFCSNLVKPIHDILIVDDAIDTGKTMFVVKNNVSKLFPNANIIIAVISWTLETSIVKPDYYIFKNVLVRFPWSKDYKGKDTF